MLKDERLAKIIDLVNINKTLRTVEIADKMDASLATVRRDLNELDRAGKVKKVFGGVKSLSPIDYITGEEDMGSKIKINMKEKIAIAEFAAGLIEDHDLVYLDAGTSVEAMVAFIQARDLTFVTNSLSIARELSALQKHVYILPGEIKLVTDSIIGVAAERYLRNFNFTVGFFGSNGVHRDIGFTTPDFNEAMVKSQAIEQCKKAYVLADSSKFGKVSQVTFCSNKDIPVITECRGEEQKLYAEIVYLKEA